jgi:tetratricopeptide (TPR) repeat protein
MWIEKKRAFFPFCIGAIVLLPLSLSSASQAQQQGQYRSKILLTPGGAMDKGAELSIEELEQQIGSIDTPYGKSSAGRHLARYYVELGEYGKAIDYYQTALAAGGLSDIANREMLRELAQVYLLNQDYTAAAKTLEQALRIKLVPEATDYLLLAQSHYRLGQYVAVVATLDRIQEKSLTLNAAQMRQALALYYRAGAYAQCERLLRHLLQLEPNDPQHWHLLASVYLQQDKKREAMDQLTLAWEKSVPFTERDIILLADLQAVNKNPYGAAELLVAAIAQQKIEASAVNYRKVFEFWLQAREQEKAALALEKAARLSGDTELYLYLARLQMEQRAWRPMYQTMLSACASQLQDKYVGRANLLLGVSQLKLGEREAARRSFINATLIGGATGQAGQWLEYMEAEPATKRELQRIDSVCYGSADIRGSVTAIATGDEGPAADRARDAGQGEARAHTELQIKTVDPLRLYYMESDLPLVALAGEVKSLALRMGVTLVKSGGAVDGPLQLISPGHSEQGSSLQLAFPVKGSPRAGGKSKIRRSDTFKCAFLVHTGKVDELVNTVDALVQAVEAAGLQLTGERRLLFNDPGGGTEIEVQIGIQ